MRPTTTVIFITKSVSQPFEHKLLFKTSEDEEEERGDINMHIVLEEHLSRPERVTLYPNYMMDAKFLSKKVQHPGGPTQQQHKTINSRRTGNAPSKAT